jgi:hypothetical protein
MSEAYVEAQDKDVANFHAGILEELSEYLPEAEPLNNLAYWQMTRGEWKKAEDLLSRASETDIEEGIAALVVFNRAVCLVMLGQPNEARVLIGQSRDSARELPEWDRMVGCLFMPVLVAGEWTVEEIFKPDLGEAYDQLAERLCSGSQPGQ